MNLKKRQLAKAAVVVTTLNEQHTVSKLLDSLINQTTKPSEIIVVDGGSIDQTIREIRKFKKIKLLKKLGNRSVGRNYGISHAKSSVIAFTDAGCIPEHNWLEELIKSFTDLKVQVVSGYYKGIPKNTFEKCLVPYVLVMPDRVQGEFFPSTRSMAMRKGVGLFDEKLSHNEDYAFANTLKKKGVQFYFAPKAIVGWMPRKNIKEAAWMFLRFAIGDIQAGIFRPKVRLIFLRYYAFFFLLFIHPWFLILVIPYLIWAVAKNFRYVKDIRAFLWLPVLQITSDLMIIFGTAIGLLSRT